MKQTKVELIEICELNFLMESNLIFKIDII